MPPSKGGYKAPLADDSAAYSLKAIDVQSGKARRFEVLEEEKFSVGMRHNAMDYDTHDKNADNALDFDEFCALIRERELGHHTEAELRKRFNEVDENDDGGLDREEFVIFSLRDALLRSGERVLDIFREWDKDGSGKLTKEEFKSALHSLGFSVCTDADVDSLFRRFDPDGDGAVDYVELNSKLREGQSAASKMQRKLRRASTKKSADAVAELGLKLENNSEKSVQEQLREAVALNAKRVIDVFRALDADGDGTITKDEFRAAMPRLGLEAPVGKIDALFNVYDPDRSGFIEYEELKKMLRIPGGRTLEASGPLELTAKNQTSTRDTALKEKALRLGAALNGLIDMDNLDTARESVQTTLRKALRKHWARVRDLFDAWDTNGDGEISRKVHRRHRCPHIRPRIRPRIRPPPVLHTARPVLCVTPPSHLLRAAR